MPRGPFSAIGTKYGARPGSGDRRGAAAPGAEFRSLMYTGAPGGEADRYMAGAQDWNRQVAEERWKQRLIDSGMAPNGAAGPGGGPGGAPGGTLGGGGGGTLGALNEQFGGGRLGRMPTNANEAAYEQYAIGEDLARRSQEDWDRGYGALETGRSALLDDPNFGRYGEGVQTLQENPDIISDQMRSNMMGREADIGRGQTDAMTARASRAMAAAGGAGGGGALVGGILDAETANQDRQANSRRDIGIEAATLNRQGALQALDAGRSYAGTLAGMRSPFDMAQANASFDRRYATPDMSGLARMFQNGALGGGAGGDGSQFNLWNDPAMLARDRDLLIGQATNTLAEGTGTSVSGTGQSEDAWGGWKPTKMKYKDAEQAGGGGGSSPDQIAMATHHRQWVENGGDPNDESRWTGTPWDRTAQPAPTLNPDARGPRPVGEGLAAAGGATEGRPRPYGTAWDRRPQPSGKGSATAGAGTDAWLSGIFG